MTDVKGITSNEEIQNIIKNSRPERLTLNGKRPITDDHVGNMIQLIHWGQTSLAADHLLLPGINGNLSATVTGVIRQLNIIFTGVRISKSDGEPKRRCKVQTRQYAYETLIEIGLNFYGLESRWLNKLEKKESIRYIKNALLEWEGIEREEFGSPFIATAVVNKIIAGMQLVQGGASMVAETGARIQSGIDFEKHVTCAFLENAKAEIEGNIYYKLVRDEKCKFGNDYALGLRWLRHLGFEQVSTNPVLAAKAYEDDLSLSRIFKDEVKDHPDFSRWKDNPNLYADEITLYATLLALWDNLHVFRPIFFNLMDTSGGGVVSFQLNPNIAHLVKESVSDVFKVFNQAASDLEVYDAYLLAGYGADTEKGRGNMVIKVAASSPAARTIARTINSYGFGSNVTVIYTVAQEVTMILEELFGMAVSVKKGIKPTQLYMTNMGGRFESHLREIAIEGLFASLKVKSGEKEAGRILDRLADANGTREKVNKEPSYEKKVIAATSFTNGQKTIDKNILTALSDVVSEAELTKLEFNIGKAGTLVARRVWGLFFSDENFEKWCRYISIKCEITMKEARFLMGRVFYLPASKRKPEDTYWTLSDHNLVHTEFGNHQENVRQMAESKCFDITEYYESIKDEFPQAILNGLSKIEEFNRGYEITPEQSEVLKEAGIEGDYGLGGLTPEEWPDYGAVRKTLKEFKDAYDTFRGDIIELFSKIS